MSRSVEGSVVWSPFFLSGLETLRHTGFRQACCGSVALGFFRGDDVFASAFGLGSVREEMAARSAQIGTSLFSG